MAAGAPAAASGQATQGPSASGTTCAYRSAPLSDPLRPEVLLASVCLVNFERASRGIAPMYVDARLTAAAQGHAEDEVRRGFFDHTNPDGCDPSCRAAAAGYPAGAGENIYSGPETAAEAVDGWMESTGHRANILEPGYRTIGAGGAVGGQRGWEWVHTFGRVEPAPGAITGLEPQYQCPVEGAPGYLNPAKLRVGRSRVLRDERSLDVFAPITSRAEGRVQVTFHAAGRLESFDAAVTPNDADLDQIRFQQSLTREQARLGTGIVTIYYRGDADTRPQEVRLRAAARDAELRVEEISLAGGRLSANGAVTSRAEGIVRLRYSYLDAAGRPRLHLARAAIRDDGRWTLGEEPVPSGLLRCGGYLSILFTGDFEQRVRGEMLAYALEAGQTRRP
ncbi:MAG: CAP domain-containing protein [Solirubrobacteraceae bacterium MAG38_C4-C5]|nr:CAP domain-containing protein [Candidatus Siliceabacter maunaloa]